MFPESGRVKDIRPGMPRRLDDELVRRGGCLAENFRCIAFHLLQREVEINKLNFVSKTNNIRLSNPKVNTDYTCWYSFYLKEYTTAFPGRQTMEKFAGTILTRKREVSEFTKNKITVARDRAAILMEALGSDLLVPCATDPKRSH
ncbi:hypothetical protein ALC60_07398 [Trachymyrmex zeteki]|uniref:Uncharacterized protein n=1 Tax=Mycetomoellerius zeteki TaxID=64791 RepID=A0A151WZY5_9HYME|nr:hypothetical protein ALC60_07398 [Trachymyrmex zeteki]